MKSVINKNTGKKLYNTLIYDIELNDDEELVDFISDDETDVFVPHEVALWKIRVILKVMGLEQSIINSFELLEEPNKTGAKYIYEYGTSIERNSPTVLFLQQVLQMTEEQVDNIFINANNITL